MGSSAIDPYKRFILIRTDRKLNNYFQQAKEVPTGTLGVRFGRGRQSHRQKTQNERGFFFNKAENIV